jgi:hypothetical protein
MAARAGRLIAALAGFRLMAVGIWFSRFFRPCAGLRLPPLEVFAECGGEPGRFPGVGRVGLFVHKDPLSRAD